MGAREENRCTLVLEDSERTSARYPFALRLTAAYALMMPVSISHSRS
jgi:galactose mutarotase-like enzyme